MTVQEWFDSNCPYNEGVLIYSKLAPNKILLKNFQSKENHYNKEKLKSELLKFRDKKHATREKIIEPQKPRIKSQEPIIENKDSIIESPIIKELKSKPISYYHLDLHKVYHKRVQTFLEACTLKMKLNAMPEEAINECFDIQFAIDKLWQENDKCWQILNHYEEHKRVMPTETQSDYSKLTPLELYTKRQLLYQNVSKRKKTIQSLENENKSDKHHLLKLNSKREQLQSLELEIEKLSKLINEK